MSSDETLPQNVTPPVAPPVDATSTPTQAVDAQATANTAAGNTAGGNTEAAASSSPATSEASPPVAATPPEAAPQAEATSPAETGRPKPQLNPTFGMNAKPEAVPVLDSAPKAQSGRSAIVPVPPTENLDAAMQAEINAAMANGPLELPGPKSPPPPATPAIPGGPRPAVSAVPVKPPEEELIGGVRLLAKIESIKGDDVFLDLGYRAPGLTQARQFDAAKPPVVGQELQVVVDRVDAGNNIIVCNLPRSLRRGGGNWDTLSVGQVVECVVNKTNKGGLEVTVSNIRGFLPASQIDLGFIENMEQYIGQKLKCQVVEVNPKKRNLVLSRRALLVVERKEAEETVWKTLEVGQKFSGKVKSVKDYGAFIDIGGVDGFLHIGEMSWTRIRHPSDVLKDGQEVEVQIVSLDREKKKIGLGLKQLSSNPWGRAQEKYAVGTTVSGKITRTTEFGAFVELETGVEGLIHISEMDHKRIKKVTDVVKDGQAVDAKVLEIDLDRRRISLSLKALKERPQEVKVADEDLAPSVAAPAYVPKRKGSLKGGTGGSGTGGLFGNPRDFN